MMDQVLADNPNLSVNKDSTYTDEINLHSQASNTNSLSKQSIIPKDDGEFNIMT